MNCFQRGHITFALVALVFALYSRRTEAEAVLCAKHFNQVGKPALPILIPIKTTHARGLLVRLPMEPTYDSGTKDPVHVAQYYRQNSYADVMDYQGAWWQCNFSAFEGNQRILGCTDCYAV
ncbi:hypothetical protein MJO28_003881 [Puccinia striiformis f. sp. tritici]|uniref:Uncharacterized protein n=1 Tax=Puccinia striiformis f. sp. tritici TaxID=168172 RepID=A0ACC0EMU5_9BASI|nr:hypothetical protein MJO28_003881 [Puccinia striiformis f. sp. tritici]